MCTAEDGIAKNSTSLLLAYYSTKTLRNRVKLHNELKLIEREAVKARIKCLCNELPFASVRPNPNGSAERSAEIDRTGSAERSVNLAEPRTSKNTQF